MIRRRGIRLRFPFLKLVVVGGTGIFERLAILDDLPSPARLVDDPLNEMLSFLRLKFGFFACDLQEKKD